MTALGLALTVAVLLSVLALVEGLRATFRATGDPAHILVLRKGAPTELISNFDRSTYNDLKFKAGIARDDSGTPEASLELVTIVNLESAEHPEGMNVNMRGVGPVGLTMRSGVTIAQGRWFRQGYREIVVGRSIASRYPQVGLGGKLHFGRGDWQVVGVMGAGQTAVNSEIFCDLNQLASDLNRDELLSSVLIRATDPIARSSLIHDLNDDQRLNVDAIEETQYYERQTTSSAPVRFVGMLVALIMSVGSAFAAMNTMYAAVSRRSGEIGTLRVLGFSRSAILMSFLGESLTLAIMGGLLGCILVLPLDNFTTGIGSFSTFSETTFKFRVTPAVMGIGILFSLLMGGLGGILPASSAARKQILEALRAL